MKNWTGITIGATLIMILLIVAQALGATNVGNGNDQPRRLGSGTLSSNTNTSTWCDYSAGYFKDGYIEITNAGTVHNTVTFFLQTAEHEDSTFRNVTSSASFADSTRTDTMKYVVRNADGACWRIHGVANHTSFSTFTYTLRHLGGGK